MLHDDSSHSAMDKEKVGNVQIQVRFERLLQEAGAVKPRGMHFCCSQ